MPRGKASKESRKMNFGQICMLNDDHCILNCSHCQQFKAEVEAKFRAELKAELKAALKDEILAELRQEVFGNQAAVEVSTSSKTPIIEPVTDLRKTATENKNKSRDSLTENQSNEQNSRMTFLQKKSAGT